MKFQTAYNHQNRAIRQLADLYSKAQIYGMLSSDINKEECEITESLKKAKCPQWVFSYCDGWKQATRDMIARKIVFCYTMPDGKIVSTHRDREDYYEKLDYGPKEVCDLATHSGHYWDIRGELRPYFVSEK